MKSFFKGCGEYIGGLWGDINHFIINNRRDICKISCLILGLIITGVLFTIFIEVILKMIMVIIATGIAIGFYFILKEGIVLSIFYRRYSYLGQAVLGLFTLIYLVIYILMIYFIIK